MTAPVQPPKVMLLQPNGEEVLYSGERYEIRWRWGDKKIRISECQGMREKSEIRKPKSETNSKSEIPNIQKDTDGIPRNGTLTLTLVQ